MNIHIQDNFLADAEAIRANILESCTFPGQDYEGHFYPGVDLGCQPENASDLIGDAVGQDVDIKGSFWRLAMRGDDTPGPIHADTICATNAGLLYFTPGPVDASYEDGTAFWRHRETDDQMMPLSIRRGSQAKSQAYCDRINVDNRDESKWDMTLLVKAQFNRFVSYPSHYYHSRYPFYAENYGTTKETARLIWVVFYDLA